MSDEVFLELVHAAAKRDLTAPLVSVMSICREMKMVYGTCNKDLVEAMIERLDGAGTLKAEYLDGLLLGVRRV